GKNSTRDSNPGDKARFLLLLHDKIAGGHPCFRPMKTRILMFGWEFPPYNSGGLGVACLGLTRALSELGAEVIFVMPKRLDIKTPWAKLVFADEELDVRVVN